MSKLATDLRAFVVAEVALLDDPIDDDTDLLLGGFVDSLGVVRIVDWLESTLGVEIDPADVVLEHFQSVAAMVRFVEGLAERSGP